MRSAIENHRVFALVLLLALSLFNTVSHAESLIPESERRNVEQTFLTYPEWFLVHSPAEYAVLTQNHPAHEFPFFGHIGQLWGSYSDVTGEQIKSKYPANIGYHVMIVVISTSTTVEYSVRGIYENSIGRASYFLSSAQMTDEEVVAAELAQSYVDFIRKEPWYMFSFGAGLKRLWIEVPLFGKQPIRKLERRFALTSEYLVKAIYAKLIEWSTRIAYEEAKKTTWVVVRGFDDKTTLPESVALQKDLGFGRAILVMPRYEPFWQTAKSLAKQGIDFEDIAGNESVILVTSWSSLGGNSHEPYPMLFNQPLVTHPELERHALKIPVRSLGEYLRTDALIEHIYDY